MIREGRLLPFETSSLPQGPWLVFAPHADDETFGMGGAILLAAERGVDVSLVVVTDGAAGGEENSATLVALREREARAAADRLGIGDVEFWRQPDRKLQVTEALRDRVAELVTRRRPAAVFFPSPMEPHPDHRATALLAWEGVSRSKLSVDRYCYEISVQGQVNRLIDITPVVDAKREAMACYASQLGENDYPDLVLALNRTRTYTLPKTVQYAEGFFAFGVDDDGALGARLVERLRPYWEIPFSGRPPLVSVIVRTKDRPQLLARALASLAEQTYPEIEVLVVNDGTVDVAGVCRDVETSVARLRVIVPGEGGGRIHAANTGLEAAGGDFVMFLDDDDWFLPQHVEKLAGALERDREAGVAYTGVECVKFNDSGELVRVHQFNQPFESDFLLIQNFIPIHAALFRRSLVESGIRLDESLILYEDWDLWVQLARKARFRYVEGVSALYLIGAESGFGVETDSGLQRRAQDAFFAKWRRLWTAEQLNGMVEYARKVPSLRQLAHDEGTERHRLENLSAQQRQQLDQSEQARRAEQQEARRQADGQRRQIEDLRHHLEQAGQRAEKLARRNREILTSTSWRITAPLRFFMRLAKGERRRAGKVVRSPQHQEREGRPSSTAMEIGSPQPLPLIQVQADDFTKVAAALDFPRSDNPLVSLVIPVYNHLAFTLACLTSIARNLPDSTFELILVDDASGDQTRAVLSALPLIRYLRNAENLGFVRTCNHGASEARGRYLMFLNNDTLVLPGWLDSLVQTLERNPQAGIAGSKLVYPSGHLQEAGANLRADGTVDLVGLNGERDDPRYNFPRQVDHCSGASLMIRTELFRELNGFDEAYAPSYFEDCDLSLRVREKGYQVIYQPASEVVHHLSVTTDDVGDGKLAQIDRNRAIYLDRWGEKLAATDRVRLIAFYLPQYHPIPENDDWWGKGFTEWTNVTKATPNFEGHYQPHHPSELGYYDLRVPDVREEQARLAREHGIYGFCYYHYWFSGKRLLDRPLNEVLATGKPDFPFCVCWANENWTRRWDGRESEVLIAQDYSAAFARDFILDLLPALRDHRYIRIDGRPLLLVYRAALIPDMQATLEIWREECVKAGVGDPYLAAVESFFGTDNPVTDGFDALVEFPPHGKGVFVDSSPHITNPDFTGNLYDYPKTADNFMHRPLGAKRVFRTAMPSWDNTARRQDTADIFVNTSPDEYRRWLGAIVKETRSLRRGDERIAFVNAWNEWAEGNHLEPDRKFGRAYLEATRDALGGLGFYEPLKSAPETGDLEE